jgi:hypothetical protein
MKLLTHNCGVLIGWRTLVGLFCDGFVGVL